MAQSRGRSACQCRPGSDRTWAPQTHDRARSCRRSMHSPMEQRLCPEPAVPLTKHQQALAIAIIAAVRCLHCIEAQYHYVINEIQLTDRQSVPRWQVLSQRNVADPSLNEVLRSRLTADYQYFPAARQTAGPHFDDADTSCRAPTVGSKMSASVWLRNGQSRRRLVSVGNAAMDRVAYRPRRPLFDNAVQHWRSPLSTSRSWRKQNWRESQCDGR